MTYAGTPCNAGAGIRPPSTQRILLLSLLYLVGLTLVFGNAHEESQNFLAFFCLYWVSFILAPPARILSPLTFFYLYYGLWFVVAPMFAGRYQNDVMSASEYGWAFAFAYAVFGIGLISLLLGEKFAMRWLASPARQTARLPMGRLRWGMVFLYVVSTLAVVCIVLASGGFAVWINDPGDAFLNRGGSGVFVILSHFSSMALALTAGYYGYAKKKIWPILLFLGWLILTSPVHGSKFQLALLIILTILPWMRHSKLFAWDSICLGIGLVLVLGLGLYFRNHSWIDAQTFLPYTLNYFTALENLAVSIRDFAPGGMETFFLPFNKFLMPFGLSDPSFYFDMNHYLTDIYFPHAWEIRATEQWPVETDLYLNFYFFAGLPVVAAFLWCIGVLYGMALRWDTVGAWFASTVVTIFMISHLRGSLINHTDFYMYPYIFMMFFLFRRYVFRGKTIGLEVQPSLRSTGSP